MVRALDFILWQIGQGKNFLRDCKPKFLQKFCLNFFNQYLQRHFVISAEHFASVFLCLALRIGICMPLYVKIFKFEGVVLNKNFFFKKISPCFQTIVSINIFLSATDHSFVIALEFILAEKIVGLTQPKSGCFQVFYSKTARLFSKISGGISINKESLGLTDIW